MRSNSTFATTFVALFMLVICVRKAEAFFDREYDCQVSEWTAWSEPFGFGQISRHRKILRHPTENGLPCPALEEIQYTGMFISILFTASIEVCCFPELLYKKRIRFMFEFKTLGSLL